MQVYLVSLHDYAPEAIFDTLDAALTWAQENGFDRSDVIGPYEVNKPQADLAPWWEAEDR